MLKPRLSIINISNATFDVLYRMHLSRFSDYSLRVLLYLGAHDGQLVNIGEIAERHAVSESHLMKVALHLGHGGYVQTVRGKGGGMRLAKPPAEIGLGAVLRHTERDFALVECMGADASCRIAGGCALRDVFGEALAAMWAVLDRHTLADLLRDPQAVVPVIRLQTA